MAENTDIETINDNDLDDEALDARGGGTSCVQCVCVS
jgi:hypothetical protein